MRLFDATSTLPLQPDLQTGAAEQAVRKNRFSVSRTAGTMPVFRPQGPMAASFAPDNVIATPEVATTRPGFKDILDIINPLQHIPVVGHLYRKATGDEISAPAKFIGSMMFGGPLGGAAALADIAIREQTGKSIGGAVMALAGRGTDEGEAAPIQLAARKTGKPRMAGTIPVWGGNTLAPQTDFAMLLNRLSVENPKIS